MRVRGPQIGVKLLLIALPLFILPWLGYRYVQQTESFVLSGQQEALRMAAQAVATVLHGRHDLFSPLAGLPSLDRRAENLYAAELPGPVRLDAQGHEWSALADYTRHFGGDHVLSFDADPDAHALGASLTLGRRGPYLYAWVEVSDDRVVTRHPDYRRLDHSDHLRISVLDDGGQTQRFLVTAPGSGPITAYRVDEQWRHALGSGRPDERIRGEWRATESGYALELRIPQHLLGETGRLRLEAADVDDPVRRRVRALVGTWPAEHSERFNRVLTPSPELDRILRALELEGAGIFVVDSAERVRAEIAGSDADRRHDPGSATRYLEVVRQALNGEPASIRLAAAGREPERLVAAWPIRANASLLGAVILERPTQQILASPRHALERFLYELLAVLFVVALGLIGFAWRLTWRIRRLSGESAAAIDPSGRLRSRALKAEARSGDALGDLSRGISELLGRLARYTGFLEGLPRTLRHELSNPLNTLSTSLQGLVREQPELDRSRYLRSAERGVARLGEIVQGMTDAASLEEALDSEDRSRFDLGELVTRYLQNVRAAHPRRELRFEPPGCETPLEGSDFRIEQLLDKLIDNAVDFSPPRSPIELRLQARSGEAVLTVANSGPPLPDELGARVFDSLVSDRADAPGSRPHVGLGLYVVRAIAEGHGGKADARNRGDGRGVEIEVRLPLAS